MLSALITVHTPVYIRSAAISRLMCGRLEKYYCTDKKNHDRTSGVARMYLGLSGLDYTSSRWVLVGFREFYNGDTCENFWSTRHGYLRSTLANAWKAVLIDAGTPIGMA